MTVSPESDTTWEYLPQQWSVAPNSGTLRDDENRVRFVINLITPAGWSPYRSTLRSMRTEEQIVLGVL